MKAQPGRLYAQIIAGRVHALFTLAELPEWNNDQVPAVDITDLAPRPTVGMHLLPDGRFMPDPCPQPAPWFKLDAASYTWQPATDADTQKTAFAGTQLDGDRAMRTLFEVIFQLANDVRTLKGQGTLTRAQLRDQLVQLYKSTL